MHKLFASLLLLLALCGLSAPAFAEEVASAVAATVSAVQATPLIAAESAVAVATAPALVPNKGDTSWMLVATLLVRWLWP